MKTLFLGTLLGVVLFMASGALAVIDGDDDMMGMYWDLDANITTIPISIEPVDLHIILTNPTMDAINGFECGFYMEAVVQPYLFDVRFPAYTPIIPVFPENMIIPFDTPVPCTEATVLATFSVLNVAGVDIGFYLHRADPPSIPGYLPVILLTDNTLTQVGTSTIPGTVTAVMGTWITVIPVEKTSWDSVKSLYR